MTGLYIHIPFCVKKCNYCDFYSVAPSCAGRGAYADALCSAADRYRGEPADTVYFGGGNPLLMGEDRLCALQKELAARFSLCADSEITLEANPEDVGLEGLSVLRRGGFTRISIGIQTLCDDTLRLLGRRHDAETAVRALKTAVAAGFEHVSADLMLGLPGQTVPQVRAHIAALAALGVDHLSAYLLKIEPGTAFAAMELTLPGEEETAELYLAACEECERHGLAQYEISNFARPGGRSRHNLKYWRLEPYLGFGPAAHSYFGGRRFYYPRSLEGFLADPQKTADDGSGGGADEQIALSLRLTDGLALSRLGTFPELLRRKMQAWSRAGLCRLDGGVLRLTPQGFLVSNEIIAEILAQTDA